MQTHELLGRTAEIFKSLGVPYLVTGSMASMAYGEPRMTLDIDIVAALEQRHVEGMMKAFPKDEYFVDREEIMDALRRGGQFNIIHPASGLKVDVIIKGKSAFDESRFSRGHRIAVGGGHEAVFASPEDVILKKLEYFKAGGSDKHLRDIAGILKVSSGQVDTSYITLWAGRLGLTDIWIGIVERLKQS
jgi:hypothetical protein